MSTFVEIINQGSLTGASIALNKSLPSVVRTLANLELSLQVKLLNRSTRQIALTQEGKQYLERCRDIISAVEEAESEILDDRAVPKGMVRITAPVMFGNKIVASSIFEFLNRYPDIQVELFFYDQVIDLIDEGVDVAIRIAHLQDSSMISIPLGNIQYQLCASPSLIESMGTLTHPYQLSSLPCISYATTSRGSQFKFKDQSKNKEFSVQVTGPIHSNEMEVHLKACIEGLGIGQFLSYQVEEAIQQNQLQPLLQNFQIDSTPVSLVYPTRKLLSKRTRILLDWMKNHLRKRLNYPT